MWKLGAVKNSEWVKFKKATRCVIPLECEHSQELVSVEILKNHWQNTWLETAQCDVIRVKEGLFVVNPSGFYSSPPIFQEING